MTEVQLVRWVSFAEAGEKKIEEEDLEAITNELITTHESFWALIPTLVGPRQWPSMFIHTSQMNRLMLEINGHFC